jgi:hypothetical protein
MKRASYLALLVLFIVFVMLEQSGAQSKEMKKMRLNVFRIDAAMVPSRAHGYFAGEGLEVDVTPTPTRRSKCAA